MGGLSALIAVFCFRNVLGVIIGGSWWWQRVIRFVSGSLPFPLPSKYFYTTLPPKIEFDVSLRWEIDGLEGGGRIEGRTSSVLIHEADPYSWPVIIIIFTYVFRPSTLFKISQNNTNFAWK